MSEFQTFWEASFADTPPIGFLLRKKYKDRWFRIHTLPDSERYSERKRRSAEKETIILSRVNSFASEILGEGSECYLVNVTSSYFWRWTKKAIAQKHYDLSFSYKFNIEDDEDDVACSVYSKICKWNKREFDPLLLSIEKDEESAVLWVSVKDKTIIAPYDGGVDVILPHKDDIASLKAKFSDWLPQNPEGL